MPALNDLETLSQADSADESQLKLALAHLGMEVNSRLQTASASSSDFMTSVVQAIKQLKGTGHAELRINCLIDASHFFYLIGQPFNAIEPASEAVELASKV